MREQMNNYKQMRRQHHRQLQQVTSFLTRDVCFANYTSESHDIGSVVLSQLANKL